MADKHENKNDHVVIALFESQDFANYGIDLFKKWDSANNDVSLGSIGTITKEKGKIKTHQAHKTGGGAKLGAVLGVIAAVLTGGTSWLVGAIGGSAIGAVTGTFFKKSLHLSKEEIAKLGEALDQGKVAVVVTCDADEVDAVGKALEQYGGDLTSYAVPADAIDEAAATIAETGAEVAEAAPVAAAEVATEAVAVAAPEAAATEAVATEAVAEVAPEAAAEDDASAKSAAV